jgi:hypothetical protein
MTPTIGCKARGTARSQKSLLIRGAAGRPRTAGAAFFSPPSPAPVAAEKRRSTSRRAGAPGPDNLSSGRQRRDGRGRRRPVFALESMRQVRGPGSFHSVFAFPGASAGQAGRRRVRSAPRSPASFRRVAKVHGYRLTPVPYAKPRLRLSGPRGQRCVNSRLRRAAAGEPLGGTNM